MSADGPGFFRSRWVAGADRSSRSSIRPRLAPGFRAAGAACGLKAAAAPTSASSPATPPRSSLGAAADPQRRRRRPGPGLPGSMRRPPICAPRSSTRATRTPPPGSRATRDAVAMQRARAAALDLEPARSRSPRPGTIGVPLDTARVLAGIDRSRGGAARRGRRGFLRRDHDHRRGSEALLRERRRRHPLGPGQGRRDDRAGLRDHALLRADGRDRRRPRGGAARGGRRLLRTDHRRRPDEHERHGAAAGERLEPAGPCRRAAGRACCCSSRSRSSPTERAPPGSAGSRSAGRRTRPRPRPWPGRSPTRRWSRPPSTAATRTGGGSPRRPVRRSPARSSQSSGPDRDRRRRGRLASSPRPRSSLDLRRGAGRAHVFFSDLTHEYIEINAEYTT